MSLSSFATAVALALVAACTAPGSGETLTLGTDLTRPTQTHAPTIPMAPQRLDTQADFDGLEKRLLGRMSLDSYVAILAKLAEAADPGVHARDALLLQRLALAHLRSGAGPDGMQGAFQVADRLRTEAPTSPHSHYLLSHITHLILRQDADHAFHLVEGRRDVADRLVQHWGRLLKLAPDYVGPYGRTAKEIRADLAAIQAALGALPAPDTTAGASPPSVDTPSPGEVVAARRDWVQWTGGTDVDRLTLCRDREETRGDDKASTVAEHWTELRCCLQLGLPDRALRALVQLAGSTSMTTACPWLARIDGGDPALRASVKAAASERGLPDCP